MATMTAGMLRQQVVIQSQGTSFWSGGVPLTETGGEVNRGAWSTVATIRCLLEPLSSSERRQALHAELLTTHRCTIRAKNLPLTSSVTPERLSQYRVKYTTNSLDRYFAIDGVRRLDESALHHTRHVTPPRVELPARRALVANR